MAKHQTDGRVSNLESFIITNAPSLLLHDSVRINAGGQERGEERKHKSRREDGGHKAILWCWLQTDFPGPGRER